MSEPTIPEQVEVVGGPHDKEKFGMYVSDSRELKSTLSQQFPEQSDGELVDVTLTSPPYADKKNYECDAEEQIGWGQSYGDYLEELRDIYRQVYSVTKDTGTLWIVVNSIKKDQRLVNIPFDIADVVENLEGKDRCGKCDDRLIKNRETGNLYCEKCGWEYNALDDSWRLQEVVIWDKVRARPWSRMGQFRNVFEYILLFSKTKEFKFNLESIRIANPDEFQEWWVDYPERYNPRGKVPDNTWEMVTPTQGSWGDGNIDHPAPFPQEMVERIVRLTTNEDDVVLDPFAGSGTVLAMAEAMNRQPIGFELSETYSEMYLDLREEILEEWQEKVEADETLERQQERLEKTICTLRQLNFPRELTRRVRKDLDADSLEELGINTAFQLSHEIVDHDKFREDHLFMEDDLYFVVDEEIQKERRERIQASAKKCADEPPCSKFGIVPNIEVVTISEMEEIINSEQWGQWEEDSFYLYANDTQNIYEREITIKEWRRWVTAPDQWRNNFAKNHYPPIISNLECEVEKPNKAPSDREDESDSSPTTTLSDF